MNQQDIDRVKRLCYALEIDVGALAARAADHTMSGDEIALRALVNHVSALGRQVEAELMASDDGVELLDDLAALRAAGLVP